MGRFFSIKTMLSSKFFALAALMVLVEPSNAAPVNGTITGIISSFSEGSGSGASSIFGFGNNSDANGQTIIVNYQFDTATAPIANVSASCVGSTGKCIYDSGEQLLPGGTQFFTASATLNGVTLNLTNPPNIVNTGVHQGKLEVENDQTGIFISGAGTVTRDALDMRLENRTSPLAGVGNPFVSVFVFNTLIRDLSEGLTANLALAQTIDWVFARDGVTPQGINPINFKREGRFDYTDSIQGGAVVHGVTALYDITEWQQSAAVNPVPVPAALPLFLSGLLGLGLMARRKRKQAAA